MKNLIISLEKLPQELKAHLEESYPHGFYHETFEFEMPGRNEIYEALRTTYNGITYMIKVDSRKKKLDMGLDRY
ncbi:MAG: hypothetical protein AB8B53_05800 [Flavobacteriales bacterium]